MNRSDSRAEYGVASVLRVFLFAGIVWLAAACAAPAATTDVVTTRTPTPAATTDVVTTRVPTLVVTTSVVTAPAPTASRPPLPTPKPTLPLVNIDLQVDGIMSVEDLNTLMLAIRALPGIDDVQGGVGLVQVSYDPAQVTRKQIVDIITGHGYTVKE